ncbi:MAG: hypothetical protein KIT84_10190 [Labilithrix sp.]|nr:hypothetical protein [Labilithrix sp.]MCW5811373.1 hypothetical protein [Labilithrix sp.]
MAAATTLTDAETVRGIREIADRIEAGVSVSTAAKELAIKLAHEAKHARFAAAVEEFVADHGEILTALSK